MYSPSKQFPFENVCTYAMSIYQTHTRSLMVEENKNAIYRNIISLYTTTKESQSTPVLLTILIIIIEYILFI